MYNRTLLLIYPRQIRLTATAIQQSDEAKFITRLNTEILQ